MAALGTFLRKYWILIVIVLWVIAWFNRDWLAGSTPAAEDARSAEEVVAEVAALAPAREAAGASAPAGEPAPAPAPEPEPAPQPAPAPEPEPAPVLEPASEPEPAVESAPAPAQQQREPARAAEAAAVTDESARLIARARAVQRDRGPSAAAAVLTEGLRDLPADTPGLADVYGELGNFHFMAGNFTAALSAYDSAVQTLPEAERAEMLRRLAPLYDRFHPAGRSHLQQFR